MSKRFHTGVVIGKFYPPHAGHAHLINTAVENCDHVTVIVCGKKSHTIDPELRASWIRQIHSTVDVKLIDDVYPETDSPLWARLTIGWLGYIPDAAFTSEAYGEPWSRCMGCAHVSVDPPRKTYPISGTLVREAPLEHLDMLHPIVRSYFVKRVVLVGAESTGKSTLAQALAEEYQTSWVPEVGRYYWEGKMHDARGLSWCTSEFVHIARLQTELEDALAEQANKVLFSDTDAFATSIWHERYVGHPSSEVQVIASARKRPDLYVLTSDDIPFVQDGTRDGEHIRHWMHERFEKELSARGVPFVLARGSLDERIAQVKESVDRLLKV